MRQRHGDRSWQWTHFVLLLLVVICGSLAYGQTPSQATRKKARTFEDYQVRTLKEIARKKSRGDSRGNKEETMLVYSNILPSRVRVTYKGSTRSSPQIKKEVLRQWARLYAGFPEGYTGPYETEMLFIEGRKKYWLAVRTASLPLFERELKQGETVDLFLIRVGAARTHSAWELVLLVELFQKAK